MLKREEVEAVLKDPANYRMDPNAEARVKADAVLALMQPDEAMVERLTKALAAFIAGADAGFVSREVDREARACLTAAMGEKA